MRPGELGTWQVDSSPSNRNNAVTPSFVEADLTVVGVGVSQIPATAGAVVLNVTGTQSPGLGGNVRVYPCGVESVPTASNLNFRPGQNSAKAVISKVGEDGQVCLLASEQVELVADVTGWFPDS